MRDPDRDRLPSQGRPPCRREPGCGPLEGPLAELVDRFLDPAERIDPASTLRDRVEALGRRGDLAAAILEQAGPDVALSRRGVVLIPPGRGERLYREYRHRDLDAEADDTPGAASPAPPRGAFMDEDPAPSRRDYLHSTLPGPGRD